MPGTNLTRGEARERARLLDVHTYVVELDLSASSTTFPSTTTIRFGCSGPGASTFADLVDATVSEITLNGATLPVSAYSDSRIVLDGLAADNELRVVADCTYSRSGEGLHRFVDPADDRVYLYSQFEVPDARRMYTTFEQPDLKATFEFHVTAPSGWAVVSNSSTPTPEPVRDGVSIWRFAPTQPISTYITALIAGEYDVVRDVYSGDHADIPLGTYFRRSLRDHVDADVIHEVTKQGFAFFESAFGMGYPFGKYDQLFVPEYNMGAMENAAAVTIRDEYLFRSRQTIAAYEARANTILHEMAHMWFGDLVTMRWWDDLWLNESFAEWAAHHASVRATQFTDAWTGFANGRKTWAYRQDQLPSTHPIAADNRDLRAVEVNFDGITYAKGASALRQLVAWVGEEQFFEGLRHYFREHAYANTELTDLLRALEQASGRELGSWTKEWLQSAGVNTLRSVEALDAGGCYTSFAVEQTAHPEFPTLRRHRIAIGLYDRTDEGLVRRTRVETDIAGELTEIPGIVGERKPDLVLLNDDDLTYAKIRLDERSLDTLIEHIEAFTESLPRALAWGAAWDMTRDAEMPATDFVTLVLRGIESETDLTAVSALLRQAQVAIHMFTAPEHVAALAERWERGIRTLLEAAEPESDHQLALARTYARAARSDAATQWLRDQLSSSTLPGMALDTDLRWTFVTALTREGVWGDAEIDAELARDNTISGQELAAAARSVQPTAEAKQRAWDDAVVRDDVPNETQRSIAFSFQVPGQDDVLAPYVDRYLERASTIWEDKGTARATMVLLGMFPRVLTSESTLRRVDDWLASTDANPAARRLVGEGRDDLQRALRAQARDAQA
ncbi:MAG: aminopeptidase N [Nocardioidaceae bacterium]